MKHTKPNLTAQQRRNLRKLAKYLLGKKLKAGFSMTSYGQEKSANCGTIGCAAGHGPYAGIEKKPREKWGRYCKRVFLNPLDENSGWQWCFEAIWKYVDDTPRGAAKRILYMLENGIPENAQDQACGEAPLCYRRFRVAKPKKRAPR
jgi:hypothetical protein